MEKNKNKNKGSYYILIKTIIINLIDEESVYTNLLKINNITLKLLNILNVIGVAIQCI